MSKNVEIRGSICYDFLASLARINNNDHFTSEDEFNQNIYDWFKTIACETPDRYKKLLNIYFNLESSFGMMLSSFVRERNIQEIEDLISEITEKDSAEIILKFLYSGIGPQEDISIETVRSLINGKFNPVKFMRDSTSFFDEDKWQLVQFVMDPDKMKEDIVDLMRWFYDNFYKDQEQKFKNLIEKYEVDLESKIRNYGQEYVDLLAPFEYRDSKRDKKLSFAVSYNYENTSMYNVFDMVFIFGYKHFSSIESKHSVVSGKKVFKALADEKRLTIIKTLLDRPKYGHELAKELDLTNATITHHMAMLVTSNLVSSYRDENKIYFELSKEGFREVINKIINDLLEN